MGLINFLKFSFGIIFEIFKFIFFIFIILFLFLFFVFLFNGTIYIELFIILIIFFSYIFWKIWLKFSTKRLLKKYKPENDKGKKFGENFIRRNPKIETGKQGTEASGSVGVRPAQPERRSVFPTADTSGAGKTLPKHRKAGNRFGEFLRRRKGK